MSKHLTILLSGLALLCAATAASGFHPTEFYIPVGQSPGLSGKYTTIAKVENVDVRAETLTLVDGPNKTMVHCNEETRIWIDNSQLRRTNQVGALSDCRNHRVEIKYVDNDKRAGVAEWIKVEMTGSN